MKNKPAKRRKKKEGEKRERGRKRRTQRHRDAYAITPTESFKFSPNYWAVFHVVRASKLSLGFPPPQPYFFLRLNLLRRSLSFPYISIHFFSRSCSCSLTTIPFQPSFEIKVDRVNTRASCRAPRSSPVDLSFRSLSVVRHESLLQKRTTNIVGIEKAQRRR